MVLLTTRYEKRFHKDVIWQRACKSFRYCACFTGIHIARLLAISGCVVPQTLSGAVGPGTAGVRTGSLSLVAGFVFSQGLSAAVGLGAAGV